MISQKDNDNSPEAQLKVGVDCNLTDREFKVADMKKLNEV